jgi:hypothetical protein
MAKKRTRAVKNSRKVRHKGSSARAAGTGGLARARRARFRDILTNESPRRVAARSRFEAPVSARAPVALSETPTDATVALTFVAVVTHDGPWELRSLVVNDFQILDTTILSTDLRIDVPIPGVFGTQLAVNWSILAGHLIPGLATFIEPAGQNPVKLAEKAPLKKGESWTPPAPSTFP